VDSFVIKEAVAAASAWPGHLRLAVNISPMQLRKAGFAQTVIQTLQVAGFDPQRLELELTQIAIAAESAQAVEELDALRALGVKTTLDHLDASHSSLVNLVALPIDRLKIDERLVAGMGTKPMCASIIKISAEVARAMNIEATAEGVKTSEQLEVLRSLGCTEVQGDLFGKPRPASELDGLYMSSPLLQECV
jgi:EAL domain-containing protein (putative c-di-GMP-specific phosphodiesterase class I)